MLYLKWIQVILQHSCRVFIHKNIRPFWKRKYRNASRRKLELALFEIMPSKFSIVHEIRASRWGRRLRSRSVNEYSTLGGTAGYDFLKMRPSSVSVLSVAVSIFWEMSGMRRYMSLNRNIPCCSRVYRTNIAHLSPMRESMLRRGHLGKVASWIVYLSINLRIPLQK